MINYHDAISIIEKVASSYPAANETVKLHESLGRILAEDVVSPEMVPSFTNSSMDGFAVHAADTETASSSTPVKIRVNGMVAAGDLKAFKYFAHQGHNVAVEIMTGAPVPVGGLNAVIKIEDVSVERSDDGTASAILISKPIRTGENIRPLGTDYQIGQLVLRKGTRIAPEHILAASALGVSALAVKKWPKIVVISTGNELVSPDTQNLEPGMIRNSTGSFLIAAAQRMGITVKYCGVVQDDPVLYRKTLELALSEGAEMILSTGAVSMGKFDFVSEVLSEMGASTHFHKISIRPGKPILFAEFGNRYNNAMFFGVPGNPVSTAVGLRFFVEPYLRKCLGLMPEKSISVHLAKEILKPEGLRCFYKGKTKVSEQGLEVDVLQGQASYMVSSLVEANCWVVLPEAGERIGAGTPVAVYPLANSFETGILS